MASTADLQACIQETLRLRGELAHLAEILGVPQDDALSIQAIMDALYELMDVRTRALQVAALGLPRDSPHFRPFHEPGAAVFAARHILGED